MVSAVCWSVFCLKIWFGPLRSDQKSTAWLSLVQAIGKSLRSSRVNRRGVVDIANTAESQRLRPASRSHSRSTRSFECPDLVRRRGLLHRFPEAVRLDQSNRYQVMHLSVKAHALVEIHRERYELLDAEAARAMRPQHHSGRMISRNFRR